MKKDKMMKGSGGLSDVLLCMHGPKGTYAYTTIRYSERDRTKVDEGFLVDSPKNEKPHPRLPKNRNRLSKGEELHFNTFKKLY